MSTTKVFEQLTRDELKLLATREQRHDDSLFALRKIKAQVAEARKAAKKLELLEKRLVRLEKTHAIYVSALKKDKAAKRKLKFDPKLLDPNTPTAIVPGYLYNRYLDARDAVRKTSS